MTITAAATTLYGQADLPLDSLTVPADRLTEECRLSHSRSMSIDATLVRSGLWAGLPITSNPWKGNDPVPAAAIRERIDPAMVPDGPPLSVTEAARFRLRQADDVVEAYAAIYALTDSGLVTVYAVTLKNARNVRPGDAAKQRPGRLDFVRGRTHVTVAGARGPCFDTVAEHVREVAAP